MTQRIPLPAPLADTAMAAGLTLTGLRSSLVGPFDLTLDLGACASISGASGSGKSLLLRMVADLDPNEGQVSLNGSDRTAWSAPDWRKQVIHVPAESGWWAEDVASHFTVPAQAAARSLAERLGLKKTLLDGSVARLSTGERQRLALARALLLSPSVLLLDEPTSALDDESIERVEILLRERLADGLSILMVTHDIRQAQRLAAQHYLMSAGRLEAA